MAIPKIIHQTYRNEQLPPQIQFITERLRKINSNWDYRFYTDDDILSYLKTKCSDRALQAYLKIKPEFGAARADLFRYLVLYNEGGVYIDIKSTCMHPLDYILSDDDTFIITQWQNEQGQTNCGAGKYTSLEKLGIPNGEYQQWFIICEKNSPIMKHVTEKIIDNILNYRAWHFGRHSYGKKGVLFVTGPVAYTRAIFEVQNQYPIRFERYDKDIGFVYSALVSNSHEKILKNHYSKYKTYIVTQGSFIDFLSLMYVCFNRITKEVLKKSGKWRE